MSSNRIAVFMKRYLGDAVMATPLIDLLCAEAMRPIVASSGTVLELLTAPDRNFERLTIPGERTFLGMIRQGLAMRRLNVGTAVVVNRSLRAAIAAKISGARVRVGHDTDGRRFLLTKSVPYDASLYEADCYVQLARLAGWTAEVGRPRLSVSPDERAAGKFVAKEATVALQPGNRHAERQLPVDTLFELANEFLARGEALALLGGPEESSVAQELERRLDGDVVNLVGKTSIRETMGVLSNLRLLVGGVAGLMHVGVGVGCPTITVFGSQSGKPSKWGHPFSPHQLVLAPDGDMSRVTAESILRAVDNVSRT